MRSMTRRFLLVSAASAALAGCTSMDDVHDAIDAINPLSEKQKRLPGERMPVGNDQTPMQMAKGKSVSVPSARTIGTWGQGGGPAGNNPGNAALSGSGGQRIWAASAGEVGPGGMTRETIRVFARPVAADGRVFVYDPNGNVSAHSADTGGRLWKVSVRPPEQDNPATGGGVATDGARVYAATGFRTITALDAGSGQVVWKKELQQPAHGSPAVADGKIYIVTGGNTVVALNASDGSDVWSFRGVPEASGLLKSANPAVSGGFIVVPFTSGELVALDVKAGKPVWTETMAQASRGNAVSGLSDISASPVIEDGVVYATGVGSRTAALSLKTGQRLWEQSIGSAHTPAVAGNAMFLVDLDDRLMALDRKNGEVMWANQLPVTKTKKKRTNWAGPVLAGGQLWLVSNEGGVIAVDPSNGQISATRDGGDPAMMAPIVANGHLVVLGGTGTLAAYN